jgi:hypothetical protein
MDKTNDLFRFGKYFHLLENHNKNKYLTIQSKCYNMKQKIF